MNAQSLSAVAPGCAQCGAWLWVDVAYLPYLVATLSTLLFASFTLVFAATRRFMGEVPAARSGCLLRIGRSTIPAHRHALTLSRQCRPRALSGMQQYLMLVCSGPRSARTTPCAPVDAVCFWRAWHWPSMRIVGHTVRRRCAMRRRWSPGRRGDRRAEK